MAGTGGEDVAEVAALMMMAPEVTALVAPPLPTAPPSGPTHHRKHSYGDGAV